MGSQGSGISRSLFVTRIWFIFGLTIAGCATTQKQPTGSDLPEAIDAPELTSPQQILEAAASSLEPSDRALAIGPLIHAATTDEWALRGLYDPDPWVQRAACLELLALGRTTLIMDYLSRDTDPYVRGELGAQLVLSGSEIDLSSLRSLWQKAESKWDEAPLALPGSVLGDEQAIAVLGAALARGSLALEQSFVVAVGNSNQPAFIPYLQTGAQTIEEELELPYAAARVALGDSSAEPIFRKAFNDPNPEVALEAIDQLIPLQTERVTQLLKRALNSSDNEVSWYAVLALTARHQGNYDKIIDALNQQNWEIRLWAIQFAEQLLAAPASGRRQHTAANRALLKAVGDENPLIRIHTARSLRWASDDVAKKLIPLLLNDSDLEVRLAAASSMLYRS